MIYLCWFGWAIQAFIMVVILLNFLIAVISQTYERINSEKVIYTYQDKADLNLEYYSFKHFLFQIAGKRMQKISYLVLTTEFVSTVDEDDRGEKSDEWSGFTN